VGEGGGGGAHSQHLLGPKETLEIIDFMDLQSVPYHIRLSPSLNAKIKP